MSDPITHLTTAAGRVPILVVASVLLLPLGCGGEDDPVGLTLASLAVTTASLPDGVDNVPYDEALAAAGGDSNYSWTVVTGSLPPGLSLTAPSGAIVGTPGTVGSNTFTVQVASGDGQTATRQLMINVGAAQLLQPSELCSDNPSFAIATFEDANLEMAIRAALSLGTQDDLTCEVVSGLTDLLAGNAGITSLVGLQNLTSLTNVTLDFNSITDINALAGLASLTSLTLHNNPDLSDIQPLLDNTGLGVGDEVDLRSTNVSCADVAGLEAKGVTVSSDCVSSPLATSISNGPNLAGAVSHWRAGLGTTGPALTFQLFDDGTGRIAYDNDAFQPPAGLSTRTLYDFTWTEDQSVISFSFSGEIGTLSNMVVVQGTSFVTDFSDGTNQRSFTFLYFTGGSPPR